ncbi:MAG: N-acetyl-gamma-glutamyl-phosphate reductase [Deltaproteobacteria bacterium]|nr:N-acetyl-gamma-glutamyl-phosphate reductase [Deltaproteobacteria bacterium]
MSDVSNVSALSRPCRVAVVGATGYGGAELLRHLLVHPSVQVTRLVAKDNLGKRLGQVHLSLDGLTDLRIEDAEPEAVAADAELVCVGLPHKVSAQVVARYVDLGKAVVDLSGDYRLTDAAAYRHYYEVDHPLPERLGTFVYGMPELHRDALRTARRVASPGCFATAITLALLPFAKAGLLQGRVRVTAMTGSSGSGANPALGTHHPLRAQTMRAYKPLTHQHTPEIEQTLRLAGAREFALDFVPVSAPLVRGILATCWFEVDATVDPDAIKALPGQQFAAERLIRVLRDRLPEVNAVAGSMFAEVAVSVDERTDRGRRTVLAHCAIDNLVKGGAGQAVHALNLMLGCDEYQGLVAPAQWP